MMLINVLHTVTFCSLRFVTLRTVPTIAIAHTFCASPDTRISYRQCLLIQGYFCAVYNYPEKVGLSKYSRYPKRKLGVYYSLIIFEKCVVTPNFLFGFQ